MPHDVSDHDHPMHEGPHHSKYVHESNRGEVHVKAKKPMSSYEGHLEKQDEVGHNGKMSNKGCK